MSAASTNEPLEVKVIYSAASRRRRAGKVVPATRIRRSGPGGWSLLGAVNLVIAGVLCYAAWWPIDGFIYSTFSWKTPVPGLDVERTAQMFGILPEPSAAKPQPVPDEVDPGDNEAKDAAPEDSAPREAVTEEPPPEEPLTSDVDAAATSKYSGPTARAIIGASAYSWLTLATIASCALALAGGTALGRGRESSWRRIGLIMAVALVLGLAWGAYDTLAEYGMQYPTGRARDGIVGIILLCALLGFAIARRARGLMRLAAVTLILSAVTSVVALVLAGQCAAVEPGYAASGFLALVFVIHSAYGWILLPVAARVGR